MAEHKGQFRLRSMCRVLRIQRSGYYAWKAVPKSARTLADEVLMAEIKKSFEDSQGIYGSPRVHCEELARGTAFEGCIIGRLRGTSNWVRSTLHGVALCQN